VWKEISTGNEGMVFGNEALWDRAVRIILGLGMLGLGWAGIVPGMWGMVVKLFGLFPLLSGLIGWDPFYALTGFTTRKP